MTDSIAIVEYGSHTFRAGLAYIFPSDQEPRLVSRSFLPVAVRSDHVRIHHMYAAAHVR